MARSRRNDPTPFPDGTRFVTVYFDTGLNRRALFRLAVPNCTDRLRHVIQSAFAHVAQHANRDTGLELQQAMDAGLQPGDILVFERKHGLTSFRVTAAPSATGAWALDLRVWDEGIFSFHAATLYAYPHGSAGEPQNQLKIFRDYAGYWEHFLK